MGRILHWKESLIFLVHERMCVCVCIRMRERMCVCVCMRMRERMCVCMRMPMYVRGIFALDRIATMISDLFGAWPHVYVHEYAYVCERRSCTWQDHGA